MHERIEVEVPCDLIKEKEVYSVEIYGNKYPLFRIDRGSYIDELKIDSLININVKTFNEGVHNIQIGQFCSISCNNNFIINRECNYKSVTTTHSKLINRDTKSMIKQKGQILIQNDVFIGDNCNIISGVTIHNGAMVLSNSNVIEDVPPYAIVRGNPAKVIGYRFSKEIIEKLLDIKWWDWNNEKIVVNNKYFNEDVCVFVDKFWNESLIKEKCVKEMGTTIYLLHLDFEDKYFLWDKIIVEFIKTFREKNDIILQLFVDKSFKEKNDKVYNDFINYLCKLIDIYSAKCMINFDLTNSSEDEEAFFKIADYFICDRSKDTVRYSCIADDYDVKIISGVDIPIFEFMECEQLKTKIIKKYNKYVAIGNSITKHPHAEYWWGNWGMAATEKEKDYFHIVSQELLNRNSNCVFEALNFAEWERSNNRREELKKLDEYLTIETDLVTIFLGENVNNIDTLEDDFIELINYVKEKTSDNVSIIVIGMFWNNIEINNIKKNVANTLNLKFVNLIGKYDNGYYTSKVNSEVLGDDGNKHIITNPFVAEHPGDVGMRAIANEIIELI